MPFAVLKFPKGVDIGVMQVALRTAELLIKSVWQGLGKDFRRTDVGVVLGYSEDECPKMTDSVVLELTYMNRGPEFAEKLSKKLSQAIIIGLGDRIRIKFTVVPKGCWGENPVWSIQTAEAVDNECDANSLTIGGREG